jgi:hypothetical protein
MKLATAEPSALLMQTSPLTLQGYAYSSEEVFSRSEPQKLVSIYLKSLTLMVFPFDTV